MNDSAMVRRYALLQAATILHASLSHNDCLASFDYVPPCVDRAESLLAEIEEREWLAQNEEAENTSAGAQNVNTTAIQTLHNSNQAEEDSIAAPETKNAG